MAKKRKKTTENSKNISENVSSHLSTSGSPTIFSKKTKMLSDEISRLLTVLEKSVNTSLKRNEKHKVDYYNCKDSISGLHETIVIDLETAKKGLTQIIEQINSFESIKGEIEKSAAKEQEKYKNKINEEQESNNQLRIIMDEKKLTNKKYTEQNQAIASFLEKVNFDSEELNSLINQIELDSEEKKKLDSIILPSKQEGSLVGNLTYVFVKTIFGKKETISKELQEFLKNKVREILAAKNVLAKEIGLCEQRFESTTITIKTLELESSKKSDEFDRMINSITETLQNFSTQIIFIQETVSLLEEIKLEVNKRVDEFKVEDNDSNEINKILLKFNQWLENIKKVKLTLSLFEWSHNFSYEDQKTNLENLKSEYETLKNNLTQKKVEGEKLISEAEETLKTAKFHYPNGEIPSSLRKAFSDLSNKKTMVTRKIQADQDALIILNQKLSSLTNEQNIQLEKEQYETQIQGSINKIKREKNLPKIIEKFNATVSKLKIDDNGLDFFENIFQYLTTLKNIHVNFKKSKDGLENKFGEFLAEYSKQHTISHQKIIAILTSLNHLQIQVSPESKLILSQFLKFDEDISKTTSQIEICLEAGFDMSDHIIQTLKNLPQKLEKNDFVALIKLCQQVGISKSEERGKIPLSLYNLLMERQDIYFIKEYNKILFDDSKSIQNIVDAFNQLIHQTENKFSIAMLFLYADTFAKLRSKTPGRHDSILIIVSSFNDFLRNYKPESNQTSNQHSKIISIVRALHELKINLDNNALQFAEKLLNFSHASKIVGIATMQKICDDLVVCAQLGVDISDSFDKLCSDTFIKEAWRSQLVTLMYACCIHDSNYPSKNIPIATIEKMFSRAEQLFLVESNKYSNETEVAAKILEEQFKTGSEGKYHNKELIEVKFIQYFLQVSAFYKKKLDDSLLTYLYGFLKLNNESTISNPQKALYLYLKTAFRDYPFLSVELETQVTNLAGDQKIAGFSADILVKDTKTGNVYDIEFDGSHHYYKNAAFQIMSLLLREHHARDKTLENNQIKVCRFNSKDFQINDKTFDPNNFDPKCVVKVSKKLSIFIRSMTTTLSNKKIRPPVKSSSFTESNSHRVIYSNNNEKRNSFNGKNPHLPEKDMLYVAKKSNSMTVLGLEKDEIKTSEPKKDNKLIKEISILPQNIPNEIKQEATAKPSVESASTTPVLSNGIENVSTIKDSKSEEKINHHSLNDEAIENEEISCDGNVGNLPDSVDLASQQDTETKANSHPKLKQYTPYAYYQQPLQQQAYAYPQYVYPQGYSPNAYAQQQQYQAYLQQQYLQQQYYYQQQMMQPMYPNYYPPASTSIHQQTGNGHLGARQQPVVTIDASQKNYYTTNNNYMFFQQPNERPSEKKPQLYKAPEGPK